MNFLILFAICTMVNVILNTLKSLLTIKGGKVAASLINAVTFGFYTYIVVLTADDNLSTMWKIIITAACNLIGVYIVKLLEEKMNKERLWKIEATFKCDTDEQAYELKKIFVAAGLPCNYLLAGEDVIFNFYCYNHAQTETAHKYIKQYNGKCFVSEERLRLEV